MDYAWRDGGPKPKVSANTFGRFVESLADGESFQAVKPRKIWKEAKRYAWSRDLFTWDNRKAGDLRRDDEARKYVGRLTIVRVEMTEADRTPVKAFYHVQPKGSPTHGYMAQRHILTDRDLRLQVLQSAKRELESYIAKYADVLSLRGYIVGLREVLDRIRDELDDLAAAASRRSSGGAAADDARPAAT